MKIQDIIKLADFFTIGNLIFGMLTIFYAIEQSFTYAAIFLLIAVLFDFLDGKVARLSKKTTKEEKLFGKELDSLADVVSHGVAPAVFGYALGLNQWYAMIILLCFTIAGMLRLSRFNITSTPGYYEGIPITVSGVIFPLLYFLYLYYPFPLYFFLIVYALLTAGMLSTRKVKKVF